jgi:DNA-binding beta-propeller fold protein YncE
VSPDGNTIYVTEPGEGSGLVEKLQYNGEGFTSTFIGVGNGPAGIAVTPDGGAVYVANLDGDSVTRIATSDDTTTTIALSSGTSPDAVAITPDGSTVYVTGFYSGTVTPISTDADSVGDQISTGGFPGSIAVTPDGSSVYVGLQNNFPALAEPAPCCASTTTLPPTPGKVVVIDTSGNAVVATITTAGNNVNGIAIAPDQAPVARLSVAPAPVGSPSGFDASASTSASSPIVDYAWDFGDGGTANTSTPTTTHVYSSAADYTVTVTETDAAGTSTEQVFTGQTMSRNGGPSAVATRDITVVVCAANEPCNAQVSDGDQTVDIDGTSSTDATLTVSMGVATVACTPNETAKPREVVGLNPDNFTAPDGLHVSITFRNVHVLQAIPICYSGTKPFRAIHGQIVTQGIIPHCHTDPPRSIPCQLNYELVGDNEVVNLIVPASDPKFWAKVKVRVA